MFKKKSPAVLLGPSIVPNVKKNYPIISNFILILRLIRVCKVAQNVVVLPISHIETSALGSASSTFGLSSGSNNSTSAQAFSTSVLTNETKFGSFGQTLPYSLIMSFYTLVIVIAKTELFGFKIPIIYFTVQIKGNIYTTQCLAN